MKFITWLDVEARLNRIRAAKRAAQMGRTINNSQDLDLFMCTYMHSMHRALIKADRYTAV